MRANRLRWLGLFLSSAFVFHSCGSSTSTSPTSTPSCPKFRGAVTDATGDTFADPFGRVPVSPDLTAATIEVCNGTLTLTVSFATGTFLSNQTLVTVSLDTDENVGTGVVFLGDVTLGADFGILATSPGGSGQAQIRKWDPAANALTINTGTASVTFPRSGQMQVAVPLSLLGNDDGRLAFKVYAAHWLTSTTSSGTLDVMPNTGAPPGLVR